MDLDNKDRWKPFEFRLTVYLIPLRWLKFRHWLNLPLSLCQNIRVQTMSFDRISPVYV